LLLPPLSSAPPSMLLALKVRRNVLQAGRVLRPNGSLMHSTQPSIPRALSSLILAPLVGCTAGTVVPVDGGSAPQDGGSEAASASSPGPVQDCLDMGAAVAQRAVQCNDSCGDGAPCTYQMEYDLFVANAAGGSCNNIKTIRDETSLRDTCIPSLKTISCADLERANLDPSCQRQLLL
jgi:hypothetical protein